ncbi:MAG: cation-transporting P-type ATPase [Flavobacteriales bacterium]|nr:cation-transporting P-type ATPase [Flavobacteriales bacterium]MBP6696042.1 cation-transporting P-type ATPase [Flavobacteriales bacterium]
MRTSVRKAVEDGHAKSFAAVAGALDVDAAQGLSAAVAARRLEQYGLNKLTEEKKRGWPLILFGQFKSPIVLLLVVAATLSFVFKEWLDGFAIIAVLLINGVIGFFMEWQADRAMNSLKKLASVPAKVVRDGQTIEIDRAEVVPGDVIFLEAGDMVPADARLSNAVQVQVDESALTGESVPVEKQLEPVDAKAVLAERTSMVYNATFLTKGNAHAVVVATGMNTELGRIAHLVQSADQAATPLEKRLEQFSRKLIYLTLGLVVLIFLAGLLNAQPWMEMLETSIALAVAAVPEGLPIVTTMALAQGMLRMARQHVIIKRLSAVETLGSTDVICTDKTGTLTENKISVVSIVSPLGTVDATAPSGTTDDRALAFVRAVAINCNTATLAAGDPLEVGLLQFALREGENVEALRAATPKLKEEPFSSETRIMATLHHTEQGFIVYAKGAAEELLAQCTQQVSSDGETDLDDAGRTEWAGKSEALAASGLKVIAAAYRTSDSEAVDLTHELAFAGLIGMMDPPRPEVAPAIAECRKAGIRVVMITGDHTATASNIAMKLGIGADGNTTAVNGRDLPALEGMSAKVKEKIANSNVFARVSPQQKLDLVTLLQERGHVVGMTGDGLNDAPALKKSDIGIAMGIRGTQVSQDVADIVLKDDKFTSVVLAIRQGRAIFSNIRNVVVYLLSCNLSELLVIAVAAVLGLHFQLVTLQILFINLVTDVLPALALGVIGADAGIMDRPPRKTDEPMVDRKRWIMITSYAFILGIGAFGAVLISHYTLHTTENWNPELCNNILFYTLIIAQLLHVLNMGASGVPFFRMAVVRDRRIWAALAGCVVILVVLNQIPVVREALHIQPLSLFDWSLIGSCALASFLLVRASRKFILDRL